MFRGRHHESCRRRSGYPPPLIFYLDFIRTSAGPILQIMSRLDEAALDAAWAEIESKLSGFNTPIGWEGPNELLLTMGRRI